MTCSALEGVCLVKLKSRHHEHQKDKTCVQVVALSNMYPASVFSCTLAQMLLQQHARCEVRAVVYAPGLSKNTLPSSLRETATSLKPPFQLIGGIFTLLSRPQGRTPNNAQGALIARGYADVGPREKGGGADVGGVSRLR